MRIHNLMLAVYLCAASALYAKAAPDAHEAHAVSRPERYQLYAGYSYLSNSFNGAPGHRQSLNGWDASLAFPYMWRGLRFKAETTQYLGHNDGADQNAFFIVGGFQYDQKIRHETVYGEMLFGDLGINQKWGPQAYPGQTASFTSILGGGIDTPISRRFAIRVGGDFVYSNLYLQNQDIHQYKQPLDFPGRPNYFGRITTGVVWKF